MIRRRLALLIDPTLAPPTAEISSEPLWLDLGRTYEIARNTERIAKALEQLNRKTEKRRPRNVWCQHPELHPEVES